MIGPAALPPLTSDALEVAWRDFGEAAEKARPSTIEALMDEAGPQRQQLLVLHAAGVRVDLSRQRLPLTALPTLQALGLACQLPAWRDAMFSGQTVNRSEARAALHTRLRAEPRGGRSDHESLQEREIVETLESMTRIADAVRSGVWRGVSGRPISDVVHVGIGGSQLGPELACQALAEQAHRRVRLHFLANIDPAAWRRVAAELNPVTTLFVIASKSWRTPETARNANVIRQWLIQGGVEPDMLARHLIAISSNRDAARGFGIPNEQVLTCPDWVGGRYSLWGAIGLPVMISIGPTAFREMLAGARQMDQHFSSAPVLTNAPMMLALISAWNTRLLPRGSEAVIAYSDRLRRLAAHLQQLQMESNGKATLADGSGPATRAAMPVIWGEPGTESQHSFFQALHQGPIDHAIEFILIDRDAEARDEQARDLALLANALAQSRALAIGHRTDDPLKAHPGNRPVTLIHLDRLTPERFGALIALYEHKTACLGWLWGLNPFDQWGVELGKRMAEQFEKALADPEFIPPGCDSASEATLAYLRSRWAR